MNDDDRRQARSWSEQLAREGSVTLGLAPRTRWGFQLGGALFVVVGAYFFVPEDSTLFRVLTAMGMVWGVLLISIPILPPLRRRFEVVVDDAGVRTPSGLVRWADVADITVDSISGRDAVLLKTRPGSSSDRSRKRSLGAGTFLPYTLPSSPTALQAWLTDEWRTRRQAGPPQ